MKLKALAPLVLACCVPRAGLPFARTPHLDRYPARVAPGTTVDALALNIDLAPPPELAGAEPLESVHGRALVPPPHDPAAVWRDAFLAAYFLEQVVPRAPPWQATR
jgi:hypothetical protein